MLIGALHFLVVPLHLEVLLDPEAPRDLLLNAPAGQRLPLDQQVLEVLEAHPFQVDLKKKGVFHLLK